MIFAIFRSRGSATAVRACFALAICSAGAHGGTADGEARVGRLPPPWWAGLQLGHGSTELTSDQGRAGARDTPVMSFRGGRAIGRHLRVGLELGGWLLQSGNVRDPARGESVSVAALLVQVTPGGRLPLVVEGGAGLAQWSNSRPLEFGSRGAGWTLSLGAEVHLGASLRLVPVVSLGGGRLRDIDNPIVHETGLRYTIRDVRIGLMKDFGSRHP